MDGIKQSLVLGILLVFCLALALGADIKETTQSSPVAIPTPKPSRFRDHADLVDSLQGYRITGVTPRACAQIGGIFVLFDCILITPAANSKPTRPRSTQLDG